MFKQTTFVIAAAATIFFSSIVSVNAIYEDQSFICKESFWLSDQHKNMVTCLMVNDDELFNSTQKEQLDTQFINELDTFDSIYLSQQD